MTSRTPSTTKTTLIDYNIFAMLRWRAFLDSERTTNRNCPLKQFLFNKLYRNGRIQLHSINGVDLFDIPVVESVLEII